MLIAECYVINRVEIGTITNKTCCNVRLPDLVSFDHGRHGLLVSVFR
jgi:hypothetical protein